MALTKKQIVEEINASFTKNNTEGFLAHCDENIRWTMVGEKLTESKSEIREWMKQMEGMEPPVFVVANLVADGDVVVCNGDMTMNGEDGKPGKYSFCDIYQFSGDKVAELTSFVVATDTKKSTASA